MIVTAVLLVLFGGASELVLGSFRHVFDWRWPRERYPVGGNAVRVICGRIALAIGLLLLAGGIATG